MKMFSFFVAYTDCRSALIFKFICMARLIFEFETLLQTMAILGFIASNIKLVFRSPSVFLCSQKFDRIKNIWDCIAQI